MSQPKNETFLAAELAACGVPPGRAALTAHELCRLGRRYFRLSERLCNEPDDDEKTAKARSRVRERAERVFCGARAFMRVRATAELDQSGDGLALVCEITTENGRDRTHLR